MASGHEPFSNDGPYSLWQTEYGNDPTSQDYTTVVSTGYDRWEGVNTPNYRELVRAGKLLPITPWFRDEVRCRINRGSYSIATTDLSPNHSYWTTGTWPGDSGRPEWRLTEADLDTLATDMSSKYDFLVQQAAADIMSRGFDGLTFIAELSNVKRMLHGITRRIAKEIRRHGVHNLWLEARYGWRPLVYDILEFYKYIEQLEDPKPTRAESRKTRSYGWTDSEQYLISGNTRDTTYVQTTNYNVSARGLVIADITPPALHINPVRTAWELVPFSFIVDWVIGMGDWLASLELSLASSNMTSGLGFALSIDRTVSISQNTWKHAYSTMWSGTLNFEAESKAFRYLRLPKSPPSIPQLRVKLNQLKILDLGAIVRQAILADSKYSRNYRR